MKKSLLITISCFTLMSCHNLTEKGDNFLKELRTKKGCHKVSLGEGNRRDKEGNIQYFLAITLTSCSGSLSYDSIPYHEAEAYNIARDIFLS